MSNKGKMLGSFAAGAALGAILGVLFAPAKGSETRKNIREKSRGMVDSVKNKFRTRRKNREVLQEEVEKAGNGKVEELA